MGKKEENTNFICVVCSKHVMALQNGSYRNHCPFCLSSLHVDDVTPGDRANICHGIMKAFRLSHNGKKGWQITHKCIKCGKEQLNLVAQNDIQPDDWAEVVQLSLLGKA